MQARNPIDFLFSVLLACLLVFICIRSYTLDFTHDEAYSFLNIKKFWYAQFLCNANSHWLNSLGMKIASIMGCENNWQLRWFSILCSGGIFTLIYYWIKEIPDTAMKFFAFSVACLNLFALDYFVMARGYVSGMFFEILALGLFVMSIKNKNINTGRVALFCAGLCAIANFNFFYFFVCFSGVYFIVSYFKNGKSFLKNKLFYFDALMAMGFALLVLRALLFIKRCSNDFGLGYDEFVPALFSSFIDGITYKNIGMANNTLNNWSMVLAVLVFVSAAYGILKFSVHKNRLYFFASIIYLLIILLLVFNHTVFNLPYPYYRSLLSLAPLMVILIISIVQYVIPANLPGKVSVTAVSIILAVNFFTNADLTFTFDFYHQHDAKPAFDLVQKLGGKRVGMCHEHFGVYINYYQPSDKYKYPFSGVQLNTYDDSKDWIEKNKLDDFDYLILYPPYELKYYKKRKISFTGVTVFPVSGTVVLKVN
jgi:uncharacterized membrane protein